MSDQDELQHTVRTVSRLHGRRSTTTPTVYDEIVALLVERGWVQGVERRGRALSLRAAIDEAVGRGSAGESVPDGASLARAGRIGAHLRDLTGARNLDAWSDDPGRTLEDIVQLLGSAAVGFYED
jgi:hypothetical protein